MANVADPNPWRMNSLPDSQQPLSPAPASADGRPLPVAPPAVRSLASAWPQLSAALAESFGAEDRVVWNTAVEWTAANDAYYRFDGQHAAGSPPRWLVVVDELGAGDRAHLARFQTALAGGAKLLIVTCDGDSALADDETRRRTALETATRFDCEYIGPIKLGADEELQAALAGIKRSGRHALLHVTTRPLGPPPPHFRPPTESEPVSRTLAPSWLEQAAAHVARLALADERIVGVTIAETPLLRESWRASPERLFAVDAGLADALSWCGNLAAGGSRPFAFLTLQQASDALSDIRREICQPQAPVTLVVASPPDDELESGSASLAALRQLPQVTVLAPADPRELERMLAWCADHDAPTVLWLGEHQADCAFDADPRPVLSGQADVPAGTSDVALVACGPGVALARAAARELATYGVRASVVNARFVQPLDADGLARAVESAACAVIVDDAAQQGGFGSWALEALSQRINRQSVALVQPPAGWRASPTGLRRGTVSVVDRCRFLSAPVGPFESMKAAVTPVDRRADTGAWLGFFGEQAGQMDRLRAQVDSRQLSADLARWVNAYEEVGSRDLYLWKWCSHGAELTALPCVAPVLRAHVCDTKVLSIVLCVLLDDVADQRGNSHLLDVLLDMTCWGSSRLDASLSAAEQQHATVARALWSEYLERIESYPAYKTFEPVLRFDLLQSFNTMRYSYLINSRPYLLNIVEHDLYTPHNMMQTSFATLDLMCAPDFPLREVGTLREAVYHSQCMGRIGNLLATWRRELANRDFTSGVFARAVMEGDVTLDELEHGDVAELETRIRARGHEAYFFEQWLEHRASCQSLAARIDALDLRAMVESHDQFFAMYLGSRGLL